MQTKVLEVINDIRASKNMEAVVTLNEGVVNTVGEIYAKLS